TSPAVTVTNAARGDGVQVRLTDAANASHGLWAITSGSGNAVFGQATNQAQGTGVRGAAVNTAGYGVLGINTMGHGIKGIYGAATTATLTGMPTAGVFGDTNTGAGLVGISSASNGGWGIYAAASAASGNSFGGYFAAFSPDGVG